MKLEELIAKASQEILITGNPSLDGYRLHEAETAQQQLAMHRERTHQALLDSLSDMLGLVTLGANGCVVMKARQAVKDAENVTIEG